MKTDSSQNKGRDYDRYINFIPLMIAIIYLVLTGWVAYTVHRDHVRAHDPATPVPAGFQSAGSFDAEAVYMQAPGVYSVVVRNGDALVPTSLSQPWVYPEGQTTGHTTKFLEDARPGEPIRVEFTQEISSRDPSHPGVETAYVVHLHNIADLQGGDVSGRPSERLAGN